MPHPMSGPDPSKPVSTATGVLRATPDDASFETDFADLAARFTAQSGGGLSPELSADLALEIVLNEVVEQACLATGATGAAIVLQRDGEMVCRASSGSTAPELGARLDAASGLSGECIRTQRTQRCDDVLADQRVDVEASQRLGVRSVMVMPLLRGAELVGLFELFSSLPDAFGERDERTVEALAARTLNNLELAAEKLETRKEAPPVAPVTPIFPEQSEAPPGRRFDLVTTFLGVAVLACAVLLGVLLGRHLRFQKASVRPRPAPAISRAIPEPAATNPPTPENETKSEVRSPSMKAPGDAVPAGSLLVYQNGKEVFRLTPTQTTTGVGSAQPGGLERAASLEPDKVVELSPSAAEGSLIHRVEPEYPDDARQQKIQGPVVLDVHIGADGAVQDVQVLSGPPELAQASSGAVKQWRFKPHKQNGRPVEMQTRVTLNFRLPQ